MTQATWKALTPGTLLRKSRNGYMMRVERIANDGVVVGVSYPSGAFHDGYYPFEAEEWEVSGPALPLADAVNLYASF